ncbi:flippase activity-associated protein Agl23 [Haloplanus sp. C73]|uniref:flippase activity-associated protein Agl23 n=1 Tax=Haloplanus sp. C73 TaxID=3421641 RepID=UPI003EBBCE1E
MSAADSSAGVDIDRVVVALAVVTVLALAARLVGLGTRPFHWDEARVGYWSLRYLDSGSFEYRPIAGGPFLYIVERHVFGLVGATDATARAVVAVVGGLSPLVALLYRPRLSDAETVALGGLLAASPALLYYGRFLRGDLPLAVFSLVVVGCAIRVIDGPADRTARYRYLGAAALALAVASSALVVATLLCVLAAAALTIDQRRLVGEGEGVGDRIDALLGRLRGSTREGLGALGVFLAVHLFFYAPRVNGSIRPTLGTVEAAFVGAARAFYGVRILGRRRGGEHELLPYLSAHAETLLGASAVVVGLAAVGFLVDRYGTGDTRPVVAFHAYWAGASLLVFPVLTEESAAWLTVHTVAPAVVPAAAAVGLLARYGSQGLARDDAVTVAVAALLALALAGQLGAAVAGTAYGPTTTANPLVHHAQPGDDLNPFVDDVSAAIEGNDGVDVLFYGSTFVASYDDTPEQPPVSDAWGNRLPLPWYLERMGAETGGVREMSELDAMEETPPVVIADASERSALSARLTGYESSTYRLSLWNREVVVFVRR